MTPFADGFVRFMTGAWGKTLYDIIVANKLYIGLIVLAYGAVLTLGSYNFKKRLPAMTDAFIRENAKKLMDKKSNISKEELAATILAEWKKMIDGLPKYFCIPNKRDIWVVMPNGEEYAKRFNIDKAYIKNILKQEA